MNRLRKLYSHIVEGSFLAGKVAWVVIRQLPTNNTNNYMLVHEFAWLRLCVHIFCLKVHLGFGVRTQTEFVC